MPTPVLLKRLVHHPLTWLTVVTSLFLLALISLSLTYLPVVWVELRYQSQRLLTNVFQVSDWRSLILPTINTDRIGVKYREYGMEIPELFLNEPIVFNVDPHDPTAYTAALKQGIAHAAGTNLPPYPGLGYYFAHSSSPALRSQYNAIFYLLGKLEVGDAVNLWYQDRKYEYRVTRMEVTAPEDVSFLHQDYPLPTIVLQTCWPPGTTQQRLLVFAERRVSP